MNEKWVKVYTSANFYQAEIVKQMLVENQLDAVLLNKQDSSYQNFGSVEVYVHPTDFSHALELLILNQISI